MAVQNHLTIRIHNADTLALINELTEKRGGNRNAIINEFLDAAVPVMQARTLSVKGKNEKLPAYEPSVGRELKELRLDIDDIYVMLNILESMIATLYNVKLEELDDEPVNAEAVRMGLLNDLPETLQAVKREILNRHKHRKIK